MAKSDVSTEEKPVTHFILQGKGGVGKSLVSSALAQYLQSTNKRSVACIDTDPFNQTFTNYKALKATHLNLLNGSRIDERKFDELMQQMLQSSSDYVIDNGASSFVPMSNYLIENDAIATLQSAGREVFIHSVITGGQALLDTLAGFRSLADQTNTQNLVVWLNEYFGDIEFQGKSFFEMKAYTDHASKVKGLIQIVKRNPDTFGKDMETMYAKKLTFMEAIESGDFSIMAKQRIKIVQRDLYEQLARVDF